MKNEMVNIGNNTFINADKIRVIVPADAEKVRRILKRKELTQKSNSFWNTTGDSETRTMIVLDDGMLVTSSVSTVSIAKRLNQKNNSEEQVNE